MWLPDFTKSCAVSSSSNHSRRGWTFPENLCSECFKKRMNQSGYRTHTRGPVCKPHNAINAPKSSVTGTVQQGWTVRRVLSNDRLWSGYYRPGPAAPGRSWWTKPDSEWTEVWKAELKTITGTTHCSCNSLTTYGLLYNMNWYFTISIIPVI